MLTVNDINLPVLPHPPAIPGRAACDAEVCRGRCNLSSASPRTHLHTAVQPTKEQPLVPPSGSELALPLGSNCLAPTASLTRLVQKTCYTTTTMSHHMSHPPLATGRRSLATLALSSTLTSNPTTCPRHPPPAAGRAAWSRRCCGLQLLQSFRCHGWYNHVTPPPPCPPHVHGTLKP